MRHLRNNQGFTLIELVTSIAAATVVFGAASMLMLMGVRTQRDMLDAAKEQQTARTVLTMLEDLASDGSIQMVETTKTGWNLRAKVPETPEEEDTDILLSYDVDSGAILIDGTVLIDGLNTAHAELNGQLLTFSFETPLNMYSTSTYCRLLKPEEGNGDISEVLKDAPTEASGTRADFIKTLTGEYGSMGEIRHPVSDEKFDYYSEWYIGGYLPGSGWNADTPWCACYLSWAAAQYLPRVDDEGVQREYIFATVDDGWDNMAPIAEEESLEAGDYIFFDWDRDGSADHVGAVLYLDALADGSILKIYTIEGNSSGRVAVRSYDPGDPRIKGYRTLPW